MGIRGKALVVVAAVVGLLLAVVIPFGIVQFDKVCGDSLGRAAKGFRGLLAEQLRAKKDVWLTNALQIAENPLVVGSLRDGEREPLIKLLREQGAVFKKNTNFRNVKVHVVDATQHSFVKSWAPEKWGEKLDYSAAYAKVLGDGKPLVTMEESPKGLRLKGLFPVRDGETVLGLVNFEGGLNSLKRNMEPNDLHFLYFIHPQFLPVATSLQKAPEIAGGLRLSQKDFDEDFLNYVSERLDREAAREDYAMDAEYLTVLAPVERFDGTELGVYVVGQRAEIARGVLDDSRRLIVSLAIAGGVALLLLVVLAYVLVGRGIIRPLTEVSRLAGSLAAGDLSAEVQVDRKDELGVMMRSMRDMRDRLHDVLTHHSTGR